MLIRRPSKMQIWNQSQEQSKTVTDDDRPLRAVRNITTLWLSIALLASPLFPIRCRDNPRDEVAINVAAGQHWRTLPMKPAWRMPGHKASMADTTTKAASVVESSPDNDNPRERVLGLPSNRPRTNEHGQLNSVGLSPLSTCFEPRCSLDQNKLQSQPIARMGPEISGGTPLLPEKKNTDRVAKRKTRIYRVYWDPMFHPESVQFSTKNSVHVDKNSLASRSYVHPFFNPPKGMKSLLRRFVVQHAKTHTFEMKDAYLLPPSKTVIRLPRCRWGCKLNLSWFPVAKAFFGRRPSKIVYTFSVVFPDGRRIQLNSGIVRTRDGSGLESWNTVSHKFEEIPEGSYLELLIDAFPQPTKSSWGIAVGDITLMGPENYPQAPWARHNVKAGVSNEQFLNVLVIFIDAARADCVGPGNTTFPSVTPVLDKFASEGISFVNSFSISNQTRHSIVGFLQSQHPTIGGFFSRWWNLRPELIKAYYESRPPLLPMLLRKAGYYTASIGRNHFQFGTTRLGLDPGFNVVWENRLGQVDTIHIIDRAMNWLVEHSEDRFFLLVNISPPHQPYNPPRKYLDWTKEKLKGHKRLPARVDYLAELYYADQEIGRLLERLKSLGLYDKTIILVTSDHGEVMHEMHSCHSELYNTICHTSHGLTLYDEEIHIPMLWRVPQVSRTGVVLRNTVSHLDVAPTILDLLGLPLHPRHQGRSLKPDMLGKTAADQIIYAESRMASTVRYNGWKYIKHHYRDDAVTPAWKTAGNDVSEELYDLRNDPQETKNLALRKPEILVKYRVLLREIRSKFRDTVEMRKATKWSPFPETPVTQKQLVPAEKEMAFKQNMPKTKTEKLSDRGGEVLPQKELARTAGQEMVKATHAPKQVSEQLSSTNEVRNEENNCEHPRTRFVRTQLNNSSGKTQYYFAFSAGSKGHTLKAELVFDQQIITAAMAGSDCCHGSVDNLTLRLDCNCRGETSYVRVELPDDAPGFVVKGLLDGNKLSPQQFFVGRFGLALFDSLTLFEQEKLRLACSPIAPHFVSGFDTGLFFWHPCQGRSYAKTNGSGVLPDEAQFEGKEQITNPTVRKILLENGYWK